MKPKDRTAMIQTQIEEEMLKRKDHRWEDVADVSSFPSNRVPFLTYKLRRIPTNSFPSRSPLDISSMFHLLVLPVQIQSTVQSGIALADFGMAGGDGGISTVVCLGCAMYYLTPPTAIPRTIPTWNDAGGSMQMMNQSLVQTGRTSMTASSLMTLILSTYLRFICRETRQLT